ncbi:MAG: Gfo/Idh/MocA family oxidoreductase [Planctomycetota bacterium]
MADPTDPTTTRTALIGSGFIAAVHLQVLRSVPGVRVVALCDTVPARAERLARQFGVEKVFGSLDELLASRVANAVHVLVPPTLHTEIGRRCLEHGLHVLVEKPMALRLDDIAELDRAARAHGSVLGVNHNQACHPGVVRLVDHLAAGRLGRLEHIAVVHNVPLRQLQTGDVGHFMFQSEANILLEQGVHVFSIVHRLLGECRAMTAAPTVPRTLPNGARFFDEWNLQLTCERGSASVRMAFGRSMTETTVHAIGSDGAAFVDLQRNACWLTRKTRWLDFLDQGRNLAAGGLHLLRRAAMSVLGYGLGLFKLRFPDDPFLRGMRRSLTEFHQAVRERSALDNSAAAGAAVLRMCQQAAAAAGAGDRPVAKYEPADPGPARAGEVVVLGGAGFVGRRCVQQLLDQGKPVTLVLRRPGLLPTWMRRPDVRVFEGDAVDAEVLARAFAGADCVLHLATVAGDDPAQVEATMAAAVRTAGRAARAASVRRLVYASSTAALYLGDRGRVTGAASADPKPQLRAAYARGKVAAERELLDLRGGDPGRPGLDVVIVRPAIVLGHGNPYEHSGLGLWVRDNHCVGWGRGDVPLPLVLVDDCAAGLCAALFADAARNRSYNLAGPVRPTAREFVHELRLRTGRDYHFHGAPLRWMWLQEVGKHLVKVLARRPREFPQIRDLRSRSFAAELDCADAARDLGFAPEADRERFLQRLFQGDAGAIRSGDVDPAPVATAAAGRATAATPGPDAGR